ncbi:MAG: MBL fold metallo-hydrolase [Pseudomonadales bacterium]|jgi:ribonuclease Z
MLRFVLIVALLLGAGYYTATGTRAGQDYLLGLMVSSAMSRPVTPIDGLRVFMCGTSSPLPSPDRAQACVAVSAGDRMFVVDAGAGSAANLATEPLEQLQAVLLTHFHSDHISALGDINLNSWVAGRPQPLVVMGPEGVKRIVSATNDLYALDGGYRVAHHGADLLPPALHVMQARVITPGVILDEDDLRITAFTVDHAPVTPAVGYRFDYRGRSVVISGDSVVTPTLVDAARGADLLLHDAISIPIIQALEKGAKAAGRDRQAKILHDIQEYHAPTSELGDLAEAADVHMLAVYHLVPPPRNFLMKKIFRRDLPDDAVITEDRMVFELPAGGDRIRVVAP